MALWSSSLLKRQFPWPSQKTRLYDQNVLTWRLSDRQLINVEGWTMAESQPFPVSVLDHYAATKFVSVTTVLLTLALASLTARVLFKFRLKLLFTLDDYLILFGAVRSLEHLPTIKQPLTLDRPSPSQHGACSLRLLAQSRRHPKHSSTQPSTITSLSTVISRAQPTSSRSHPSRSALHACFSNSNSVVSERSFYTFWWRLSSFHTSATSCSPFCNVNHWPLAGTTPFKENVLVTRWLVTCRIQSLVLLLPQTLSSLSFQLPCFAKFAGRSWRKYLLGS